MNQKRAIAYIRSSTNEQKQANSQAVQLSIITDFASTFGYDVEMVFSEYQTGKDDERTEFNLALQYAIEHDCHLIAYRIDRVSRSMSIFSRIQSQLPRFRFCNLGDVEVSLLLMSVLLAVATNESAVTSKRVSAAMQMLKLQGRVFGNPRIQTTATPLAAKANRRLATTFRTHILSVINDLRKAGYTSNKELCCRLNEIGVKTRTGGVWKRQNLHRVLSHESA